MAAGLGSATVIWQTKTEVKKELKKDISRVGEEIVASRETRGRDSACPSDRLEICLCDDEVSPRRQENDEQVDGGYRKVPSQKSS